MDFRDAIRSGLEEYLDRLRVAVDELRREEIRWQPDPGSNHIAWLVWHMARVEDSWISFISGEDQVWSTGGWPARLGITEDEPIANQSADEAAALPEVAMENLLAYYDAVRIRTLSHLDRMTGADLARVHDEIGPGGKNEAWVLGHILVEESQHLGQVAYIRGMIRGFES
jgi:uncharacterized damage-inducible protein DinB